ncbi:TonB-dependent receptor [Stakelama sediminis]|uniref:TonB-dependent receptor n=1 Tax=Stakelama sediminis TaxID=463200 RepID=A0A840YZP4_9SPHN|nr:TonB-dependent receptor [Stakelama sediminis]MBB5719178.1 TonB-dependent receptor [Stakelama sediminis]
MGKVLKKADSGTVRRAAAWLLIGTALSGFGATSAMAQTATDTAAAAGQTNISASRTSDAVPGLGTMDATSQGADIVVTGLRAGLERSLVDKRRAVNVEDVISAEDIGKFPDNNLAESLQRVPGITIDRSVTGEGQTINLRGMGPGFTRSEINGGTALNGFDFSVLAPELFSKIIVEKSPTAKTVEGGIAGTIKEETPKPFDIPGTRFTATAGLTLGQAGEKDPRIFALFSKNWGGKFGIAIAGAYSRTDFRSNEIDFGPWGAFRNVASADVVASAPEDLLNAATPRTSAFYSYRQKRDNYGLTASVQAQPSDALQLTADFIYARKTGVEMDDRPDAPIEGTTFYPDGSNSAGNQAPSSYTITDGAVTSATFDNIQNRVGYSYQPQKDTVYQASLRANWQPTDHLTVTPGFSYAHQKTLAELDLYSFAINGADITYTVDGDVPHFSSSATDFMSNPEDFKYNVFIFDRAINTIDEYVGRLDFTRAFDVPGLDSVQWGMRYTNRTSTQSSQNVGLYQGAALLGTNPPDLSSVSTTLPFYVGGADAPSRILSVDPNKVASVYYPGLDPFNSDQFYDDPTYDALQSFKVLEQTYAGYVQANFDVGNLKLNAGVRIVSTSTHSTGTQLLGTEASPVDTRGNYTNFLPALNARYELTPNLLIRATYSRAMTRPTLSQLSPSVVINSGPRTGTRGNPDLKPYLADQQDLGFEWYFHRGSLLTVTAFAKEIGSLISETVVDEEATFPDQVTGQPTTGVIAFTQPTNGDSATVKGIEAGVQTPFYFLPGALSNFGGILNYTYASSKSTTRSADGTTRTTPLPGLSKNSANAVLYYDNGGFDARLAYAWRSTYLRADAVGAQFGAERYIRSYGQLDFSMHLNVLKNFELGLNVNNLLDTQRKEYILVDSGSEMPASLLEQERRFVITGRLVF